jgi:hypothetical protein
VFVLPLSQLNPLSLPVSSLPPTLSGGVDGDELLIALDMLGLRDRADAATVALLLREFGSGGCAMRPSIA